MNQKIIVLNNERLKGELNSKVVIKNGLLYKVNENNEGVVTTYDNPNMYSIILDKEFIKYNVKDFYSGINICSLNSVELLPPKCSLSDVGTFKVKFNNPNKCSDDEHSDTYFNLIDIEYFFNKKVEQYILPKIKVEVDNLINSIEEEIFKLENGSIKICTNSTHTKYSNIGSEHKITLSIAYKDKDKANKIQEMFITKLIEGKYVNILALSIMNRDSFNNYIGKLVNGMMLPIKYTGGIKSLDGNTFKIEISSKSSYSLEIDIERMPYGNISLPINPEDAYMDNYGSKVSIENVILDSYEDRFYMKDNLIYKCKVDKNGNAIPDTHILLLNEHRLKRELTYNDFTSKIELFELPILKDCNPNRTLEEIPYIEVTFKNESIYTLSDSMHNSFFISIEYNSRFNNISNSNKRKIVENIFEMLSNMEEEMLSDDNDLDNTNFNKDSLSYCNNGISIDLFIKPEAHHHIKTLQELFIKQLLQKGYVSLESVLNNNRHSFEINLALVGIDDKALMIYSDMILNTNHTGWVYNKGKNNDKS